MFAEVQRFSQSGTEVCEDSLKLAMVLHGRLRFAEVGQVSLRFAQISPVFANVLEARYGSLILKVSQSFRTVR